MSAIRRASRVKRTPQELKQLADLVRAHDRARSGKTRQAIARRLADLTGTEQHPVRLARKLARSLLRDYTPAGGPRAATPGRFTADRVRSILPSATESDRRRH